MKMNLKVTSRSPEIGDRGPVGPTIGLWRPIGLWSLTGIRDPVCPTIGLILGSESRRCGPVSWKAFGYGEVLIGQRGVLPSGPGIAIRTF